MHRVGTKENLRLVKSISDAVPENHKLVNKTLTNFKLLVIEHLPGSGTNFGGRFWFDNSEEFQPLYICSLTNMGHRVTWHGWQRSSHIA